MFYCSLEKPTRSTLMNVQEHKPYEVFVKTETCPMPHYALGVEAMADVALWRPFQCILTRTVPPRYKGGWRTRVRNQYQKELTELACLLSGLTGAELKKKLAELAEERAVQVNVAKLLMKQKKPASRPANFGADFGNLSVGEREGSFSPRGRLDGYW
jgi:hypothetical protein